MIPLHLPLDPTAQTHTHILATQTSKEKDSHRPRGSKDEGSISQTPDVHLLPLTKASELQEKIIVLAGKCIDYIRCTYPSGFTLFTCWTTHLVSKCMRGILPPALYCLAVRMKKKKNYAPSLLEFIKNLAQRRPHLTAAEGKNNYAF